MSPEQHETQHATQHETQQETQQETQHGRGIKLAERVISTLAPSTEMPETVRTPASLAPPAVCALYTCDFVFIRMDS